MNEKWDHVERRDGWANANGESALIVKKAVLWAAGTMFTGYIAATLIIAGYFFSRFEANEVRNASMELSILLNDKEIKHNRELVDARSEINKDRTDVIEKKVQLNQDQITKIVVLLQDIRIDLTKIAAAIQHAGNGNGLIGNTPKESGGKR